MIIVRGFISGNVISRGYGLMSAFIKIVSKTIKEYVTQILKAEDSV
ncbi:MAG: hypothetical protein KKH94_11305 [Candidatus Omnitrophica bacterium]|nr:hypothetical protein [Candidatus Omnitrophota bacterium]